MEEISMEEMEHLGKYTAEGFSFYTQKDAALAASEQKQVEYLAARLDYQNPEGILKIYKKAVKEQIFKSPVGIFFLKNLQQYLLDQPEIDNSQVDVIPLPFYLEARLQRHEVPKQKEKPDTKKKKETSTSKKGLMISVILNIGLVVAVIAMFAVALNAKEPNILNYEKAITDRYASWEQELRDREDTLRREQLEWKEKSGNQE